MIGPQAPAQTDMPKLAAIPPKESAAPARTPAAPGAPGAGQSAPVPVTFKALLTEAGPQVKTGLIWRVFTPQPGANGARKLVSTHHEAMPTAALVPGEYLVNAAYGLSNLTKKIKVESGRSLEETFVLNTGGLKLAAVLAGGAAFPASSVHFDILSDEEDQFGNRHKILDDAKPGVVIRLNAGAYHLVSTYGDANATVRADVTVEPGKITEATVKHAAAPVTFKLVQSAGGEALADTKWSILTTTGDVVKENTGALPTHILAIGDYAVVANHNGESYTSKFSVTAGEAKQIEVVMESGPASPEALKAITEPPPRLPRLRRARPWHRRVRPTPCPERRACPAPRPRRIPAWPLAITMALRRASLGFCQIRGHCFGHDFLDRSVEGEHLLLLRSEPPHRDRPLLSLALADHEHHRHLGKRVLAHLVIDLLVAEIGLGPDTLRVSAHRAPWWHRHRRRTRSARPSPAPEQATAAGVRHGAR